MHTRTLKYLYIIKKSLTSFLEPKYNENYINDILKYIQINSGHKIESLFLKRH